MPVADTSPLRTWLPGVVVLVAAGLAAGAVAYGVVWVIGPGDGWRDLAAFASGLVVGVGAAALGWLLLLVVLLRRHVPAGRRLAAGAIAVGALAVVAIGLGTLAAAAGDGARWAGIPPQTVAVVAAVLVALVVPPFVARALRD